VEDPVEVNVPSHSSVSCEPSWTAFRRVHELTLPPDSEETLKVPEEIFTTATSASPAFCGSTVKLDTAEPVRLAKDPTAEMVRVEPTAGGASKRAGNAAVMVTVTTAAQKRPKLALLRRATEPDLGKRAPRLTAAIPSTCRLANGTETPLD
jgi:hypothetical protein